MKCKAADLDQIVRTLLQQGEIVPITMPTATKTAQGFQRVAPNESFTNTSQSFPEWRRIRPESNESFPNLPSVGEGLEKDFKGRFDY